MTTEGVRMSMSTREIVRRIGVRSVAAGDASWLADADSRGDDTTRVVAELWMKTRDGTATRTTADVVVHAGGDRKVTEGERT